MSRNFRSYTVSLTAGQEQEFNIAGEMFAVIESAGEFTLTFDETMRIAKTVAGMGGRFESIYSRVKLLSTTTQTVTLVLGFGEFNDARASVNATINTSISPSDTALNPADVTVGVAATAIVAANANRKEVLIHVPSDAANSIRVGSATVTAGAGLEVEAGSTIALNVECAIYAIRDGGSDVDVSIIDLTRP
jgi:hypothetical protein